MNVSSLEKLMITIGVTDLVSKPVTSISNTIDGMKRSATSGFDAIRGGAIGLAGAGLAIKTFMDPVYEMQEALGEAKSLDVADAELQKLQKTAVGFSIKYGESAADFVRSSYDIQSAIGGLENGELAAFTNSSNILAKGTKADADTITNYMGTMYGIFADQANAMGKAQWVEQLTGQTAAAVQMFKTTGAEMSGAFTSLGANAQAAGIGLSEQMAILGTLQATMSGSEAGTKYKAFLSGVGNAQKKLGLSFTDSAGRMLPMLDILNKLKGQFGDTLDVDESDALKAAFGSDEAVSLVKQLMGQTDGLGKSIAKINKIQGMDNAAKMAQTMVDPWEQFNAVTEALRISFGTQLLPSINNVISSMTDGLTTVMGWNEQFPNITRWVGMLTLGILAMSAATGIFSIVLGLGKTALAAWGVMVLVGKGLILGLSFGMKLLSGIMAIFKGILFVVALATNTALAPMWLVVAVVGAIVGVVGYLIYKIGDWLGWWGKLAAAISGSTWLDTTLDKLGWIGEKIRGLLQAMGLLNDSEANISSQVDKTLAVEAVANNSPDVLSAGNGFLPGFNLSDLNNGQPDIAAINNGDISGRQLNIPAINPNDLNNPAELFEASPSDNSLSIDALRQLRQPPESGSAVTALAAELKNSGTQFNGATFNFQEAYSRAEFEDWASIQVD